VPTETTTFKSAAFFKGKAVGKPVTKLFQVSKLTGMNYTLNLTNTWLNGVNINALTDGITGNTKTVDQWVGIGHGSDAEIVADMKTVKNVERFSIGILSAPGLCGGLSPEVKLYGSIDGIEYKLLAEKQLSPATAPVWEIFRPELTFPLTEVRYLKVCLKNAGNIPNEQQNRAFGSVLLVDEIGSW
jgi:hypothetical protein